MSKTDAVRVLTALMEVYDKPLSEVAQDLYIRALENDDPDLLKAAAARIITGSKWFPKVSELKEAMSALTQERDAEKSIMWHTKRNAVVTASPWLMVETWERRAKRSTVPAMIDWRTCQTCGQQYANWNDCPECVK